MLQELMLRQCLKYKSFMWEVIPGSKGKQVSKAGKGRRPIRGVLSELSV